MALAESRSSNLHRHCGGLDDLSIVSGEFFFRELFHKKKGEDRTQKEKRLRRKRDTTTMIVPKASAVTVLPNL